MTTNQKLIISLVIIGGILALHSLTRKPPVGQVFGKVIDEMGEPLSGVIVRFVWYVDDEEWTTDAVTDTYGLFVKDDLPVGEHNVSFIKAGYYAADRLVKVDPNFATGLGSIIMTSM